MQYWFSDLDNTLVYSHRRRPPDSVVIEYLRGKPQSYITRTTLSFLCQSQANGSLRLVPITSRSVEQYSSMELGLHMRLPQALVCNGGVLLINGRIDTEWLRESRRLAAPAQRELHNIERKFNSDYGGYTAIKLRNIDNLFLYLKLPDMTYSQTLKRVRFNELDVQLSGNKAYFIPKALSKGKAVERYCLRHSIKEYIASGDSIIDYSMFNNAALAFAPEPFTPTHKGQKVITPQNEVFSDGICEYLRQLGK